MRRKKIKWVKPTLVSLSNAFTSGSTACHGGSSADTTCNSGMFPGGNCLGGSVASTHCNDGGAN